jgi:hypothetical protein
MKITARPIAAIRPPKASLLLQLAADVEAVAGRQHGGLDQLLHIVADLAHRAVLDTGKHRLAALQILPADDLRVEDRFDRRHAVERNRRAVFRKRHRQRAQLLQALAL